MSKQIDRKPSTGKTNAALMQRRRDAIPRGVGQTHEVFIHHGVNAEFWDVEGTPTPPLGTTALRLQVCAAKRAGVELTR